MRPHRNSLRRIAIFYDPYIASIINIGAASDVHFWLIAVPVTVTFVIVMTVGAWIGWTMFTTRPPRPIEEMTDEARV